MKEKIIMIILAFLLVCGVYHGGKNHWESHQTDTGKMREGLPEKSDRQKDTQRVQPKNSLEMAGAVQKENEEETEDTVSDGQIPKIKVTGLDGETLEKMEITQNEVSEALGDWTRSHGYSGVSGAAFCGSLRISELESKYSMDCQLFMENQGNGVFPEENVIVTMDYYKDKGRFYFHD